MLWNWNSLVGDALSVQLLWLLYWGHLPPVQPSWTWSCQFLDHTFPLKKKHEPFMYKDSLRENVFTATQLSAVTVIFCTWDSDPSTETRNIKCHKNEILDTNIRREFYSFSPGKKAIPLFRNQNISYVNIEITCNRPGSIARISD